MELMGSTLTSTYTRPKTGHFLPAISTAAPSGARSALAVAPSLGLWRSNNSYQSSTAGPSLSCVPRENLDLVRAKTVFYPSNRTVLATRYSPDDWYRSNQNNYRESESSRKSAERLRRDTVRLIQDKDQLTRRSQENSSRNIGERLNSIVFWKSELSHELDNMVTETTALAEVKRRLERALAETEGPFQVRVQGKRTLLQGGGVMVPGLAVATVASSGGVTGQGSDDTQSGPAQIRWQQDSLACSPGNWRTSRVLLHLLFIPQQI